MTLSPAVTLPPVTRVAVVGAGGPSGLVAVSQLLDAGILPEQFVACESRDRAGGVWNHEGDSGPCDIAWRENGLALCRNPTEVKEFGTNGPSAIYDNLRTNLPNEVMNFHNFPFPKGTPVFPTHQEVALYLQDFAEKKGLVPVIQWSTRITGVYHTPSATDPAERWTVETEHTAADGVVTRKTELVSHVVICNGHYNEPYIPAIPGLQTFTGQILHSRWWRNPQVFRGKNVVVVGSRASGSDIARELAIDDDKTLAAGESSRVIYQSVRVSKAKPQGGDGLWDDDQLWARRISVVSEIDTVDGGVIHLKDGSTLTDVDLIVFATGYLYSYPFFPTDKAPFNTHPVTSSLAEATQDLPHAGGSNITNLNTSDTFYVPDPTLSFIGLHYMVNPFPLGEVTARLIAHSYAHGLIPPLPPLVRYTDDPTDIKIGFPAEFDNQDNFLQAIGEGGEDGGPHGGWPKISERVRQARANAIKQRKEILGY